MSRAGFPSPSSSCCSSWPDCRSLYGSICATCRKVRSPIRRTNCRQRIDSIRNYYASNVVGRVLAHGEKTQVLPNYKEILGAIPIPATLSLELGDLINRSHGNTQFRFFSDYPFKNRPPHAFDDFEQQALETLRQNPNARVYGASGSIFDRRVRLATPIIMAAA